MCRLDLTYTTIDEVDHRRRRTHLRRDVMLRPAAAPDDPARLTLWITLEYDVVFASREGHESQQTPFLRGISS